MLTLSCHRNVTTFTPFVRSAYPPGEDDDGEELEDDDGEESDDDSNPDDVDLSRVMESEPSDAGSA